MSMSPKKASKIMSDYAKNNYNSKKTLLENGYKESTATKRPNTVINLASKTVRESLQLDTDDKKEIARNSLDILGVSKEDVVKQLVKIGFNERDYANALKVLGVLAKDIGINLTDDEQKPQTNVNIGIRELHTDDVKRLDSSTESQ